MRVFATISCIIMIHVSVQAEWSGTPWISSWQEIDNALGELDSEPWDLKSMLLESPMLREIVASNDAELFRQMAAQRRYPFVELAGFLALKEIEPRQAVAAGVRIILFSEEAPLLFKMPILELIGNDEYAEDALNELHHLMQTSAVEDTRRAILMGAIPYDAQFRWFHEHQLPEDNMIFAAVLLDALYGEQEDGERVVTEKMRNVLNRCAEYPGRPRLIFALHAPEEHEQLKQAVEAVLLDESYDDVSIAVLASRRDQFIQEHIDLERLPSTSNRRMEIIMRTIEGNREAGERRR